MPDYRERMKGLREDRDLRQQDVADFLGTTQSMYSEYERGKNELPIRHLIELCKHYQVSADYILGFTNDPNPAKLKYK